MEKRERFFVLVVCLLLAYLPGVVGSLFTFEATNGEWFNSIRPTITPPNWVFPIVWNILYFLLALSIYFAWVNFNKKDRKKVIIIYGLNLIANGLWSFLYFGMQNPLLAFFDILILLVSILLIIKLNWKKNRISLYLVIPYLIWVCFASILNYLSI
jgi:tryptophan-rich sensory protein